MCLALKEAVALLFSVRPFHFKTDFLGLLLFRPCLVLPRRLFACLEVPPYPFCLAFLLETLGFCSGIQQVLLVLFSSTHGFVPTLHGGEEGKIHETGFVFCSCTANLRSNGVGPTGVGSDANVDVPTGFLLPSLVGPAILVTEMAKFASARFNALWPS